LTALGHMNLPADTSTVLSFRIARPMQDIQCIYCAGIFTSRPTFLIIAQGSSLCGREECKRSHEF
jgi:hypothetical protein